MARASTPTLLSLDQFAAELGIDPMHFCGGVSSLRPETRCSDTWMQYAWQASAKISREDIAYHVAQAERDLADALGYWPAPTWEVGEFHAYPNPMRPEAFGGGGDVQLRWKRVKLNRGYVIEGGVRGTTEIGTEDWTGVDADGDGFNELARFTLDLTGMDPEPSACEIKAYFKEYDDADAANSRTDPVSSGADPAWEVRPLRVTREGAAHTATVYCNTWLLFRPQLQEALNADDIDADAAASYVDELVFYREYNDPSQQVLFGWNVELGCTNLAVCSDSTQDGCFHVKNPRNGLVTPQPASYNTTTEQFMSSNWTESVEPDAAQFWYRSGWTPTNQRGCQVLDPYWARTITMLAVARLPWPLCDCSNVVDLTDKWRQDMSMIETERDKSKSFQVDIGELSNPFGQRMGEILAWRRIKNRGRRVGRTVNV